MKDSKNKAPVHGHFSIENCSLGSNDTQVRNSVLKPLSRWDSVTDYFEKNEIETVASYRVATDGERKLWKMEGLTFEVCGKIFAAVGDRKRKVLNRLGEPQEHITFIGNPEDPIAKENLSVYKFESGEVLSFHFSSKNKVSWIALADSGQGHQMYRRARWNLIQKMKFQFMLHPLYQKLFNKDFGKGLRAELVESDKVHRKKRK